MHDKTFASFSSVFKLSVKPKNKTTCPKHLNKFFSKIDTGLDEINSGDLLRRLEVLKDYQDKVILEIVASHYFFDAEGWLVHEDVKTLDDERSKKLFSDYKRILN